MRARSDVGVLMLGRLTPSIKEHVRGAHRTVEIADVTMLGASAELRLLVQRARPIHAVLTSSKVGVPTELTDLLPELEAIVNFGVGCDRIDLDRMRSAGVQVSNTPDVLTDCVADTAVGLLISVLRRLVVADRFVRAGEWMAGEFPPAHKVTGVKVGIAGPGRIGRAVARRLNGFDCEVAFYSRGGAVLPGASSPTDLVGLAQWADALVVALPGGPETERLVSREVLEALGDGVLVNVSRGSVVDQEALVDLVVGGWLGGAGLDVYASEPKVPEELLTLDNVVLLPHIGAATLETRAAMSDLVLANLESYVSRDELLTPVTTRVTPGR